MLVCREPIFGSVFIRSPKAELSPQVSPLSILWPNEVTGPEHADPSRIVFFTETVPLLGAIPTLLELDPTRVDEFIAATSPSILKPKFELPSKLEFVISIEGEESSCRMPPLWLFIIDAR